MTVLVVRMVDTHELVGFFWGSKEMVWDCVDALTDPVFCEYATLPQGGLEAPGKAQAIPTKFDQYEGYEFKLVPSESIDEALDSSLRWRRFDAADVGVGLVARISRHVKSR